MASCAEETVEILDLTRKRLKKIDPVQANQLHFSTLLLDHNELPRLDNVETYCSLQKLSASHNQLLRMYGVARLYSLRILSLSHNSIVSIEGLRDLVHLTSLNLSGNNIKSIEHLNSNVNLEVLDLSENMIPVIPDLSFLKNLKKLNLHSNRIKTLQFCERYLPSSIMCLTLADNLISDLNELSRLAHLTALEQFSLMGNSCMVSFTSYDYRPYVLNWLLGLKIMDDSIVQPKESLKAEWLYSQGKGRQFKVGEHPALLEYLQSLSLAGSFYASIGEDRKDEKKKTEEERLNKILNSARQHQQAILSVESNQLDTSRAPSAASPALKRRTPLRKSGPSSLGSFRTRKSINLDTEKTPPPKATASFNMEASKALVNSRTFEKALDSELFPSLSQTYVIPPVTVLETDLTIEDGCISPSEDIFSQPMPEFMSQSLDAQLFALEPNEQPSIWRQSDSFLLTNTVTKVASVSSICRGKINNVVLSNGPKEEDKKMAPRIPMAARKPPEPSLVSVSATYLNVGPGPKQTPSPPARRKRIPQFPLNHTDDDTTGSEDSEISQQTNGIPIASAKKTAANGFVKPKVGSKLPTARKVPGSLHTQSQNTPKQLRLPEEKAAVTIQKYWRGYQNRNLNGEVQEAKREIRQSRTEGHIRELSATLETTKKDLEKERQLRIEQDEMVKQLKSQVRTMQTGDNSPAIERLAETCQSLQTQVQQLTQALQKIMLWAVQTSSCDCSSTTKRPTSLALSQATQELTKHAVSSSPQAPSEVKHFALELAQNLLTSVTETAEKSSS